MTITFIPGEVNKSNHSVAQTNWKNHHIIVYGSGNNLIIIAGTVQPTNKKPNPFNIDRNLQTIYLDRDPEAIDISSKNGYITIAISNKIIVYKPMNEYMRIPKWQTCTEFEVNQGETVNCIKWANEEDEIIIGTNKSLYLYHLFSEYGEWKYMQRWKSSEVASIADIAVTPNSKMILTTSGPYDRLIKAWTRITYGDENTMFDLTYLPHPIGTYVTDFVWKMKAAVHNKKDSVIDPYMAKIRNIRDYIDNGNLDDGEVVYSFCSDYKFRVWASCEYTGHSQINNWETLDLSNEFEKISLVFVIENYLLQDTLIPALKKAHCELFEGLNVDDMDLLFVVSDKGEVKIYAITNASQCPPCNIRFTKLTGEFKLGKKEFPIIHTTVTEPITTELIESEKFITTVTKPILVRGMCLLNERMPYLSLLLHDRIKNTVRFEAIDFNRLVTSSQLDAFLINKFQGHTKSIRKLVKSNSSFSQNNVLLSILNFAQHNYIWEPMILQTNTMAITKRFLVNVESGIWSAVILNDVEPPVDWKRRHIVVTANKDGKFSVWDCNGSTNDDQPADLITETSLDFVKPPRVFLLTEFPDNTATRKQYCVVAVYEHDQVKAWKLCLTYESDERIKDISFTPQDISPLPQEEHIFQATAVDVFVSEANKSLVAVISEEGLLKSYTLDFSKPRIEWKLKTELLTNISRASKLHGSTIINKFAVVDSSGSKLSIWDVMQGVLEYQEVFPEENGPVVDLDWTFITASKRKLTANAILSVGFNRFVLLYTQLRYDYTNNIPSYATLKKIDISDYTSHEIGDLIWLDHGYLIIGSGNQFFIDDKWVKLGSSTIDSTIRQLMSGYATSNDVDDDSDNEEEKNGGNSIDDMVFDVSYLVRVLNGPLPIYHPQFLIQALFMSKITAVQKILVQLFQAIRRGDTITWDLNLDIESELFEEKKNQLQPKIQKLQRRMSMTLDVFSEFNAELTDLLTEKLMKISLPLLTRHQQSTLISIIAIVKELKKHSLLNLDDNGIRFTIGFKLFQLSTKQKHLSMRDINWALHSDNKELLLQSVNDYYHNRLKWENIKQTGLVYWTKTATLTTIMEQMARNEFSDCRDPSGMISLFYLALKKKQILIGLWRTVHHAEQQKMLKFLNNDFTQHRWKSAALKNAFVLLGKHRYIDAAYFFLLGDAPLDCCNILANKLNDTTLAIAIAKIYGKKNISDEHNQLLYKVIEKYVLPEAIKNGDRWTTSWIFWQIREKELSIQALIKSPIDIATKHFDITDLHVSTKGQSFLRDDPVLIILFNDLRNKKINYLKGSLDISKDEEYQFIIKVCMIYTRMGCDYLALELLRNWNFETKDTKKPDGHNHHITKEPTPIASSNLKPPSSQAFEEPDMSSFDFGF
ncbi:Regulator of V-ATPase in vacuolar membrane protein 1 [Candida viswanathii]|uniref:Regulator of V-ATPase in vacuolar membrane protein 1 n=1 Tax=Candida viswanathii TaxID=5486 RepID=A0A367XME0_9ASCO|nr:Regulator of V-ATPase in vacuolar membrane protein 1 [Candida viswanathii]